jgi:hypothetical protein
VAARVVIASTVAIARISPKTNVRDFRVMDAFLSPGLRVGCTTEATRNL